MCATDESISKLARNDATRNNYNRANLNRFLCTHAPELSAMGCVKHSESWLRAVLFQYYMHIARLGYALVYELDSLGRTPANLAARQGFSNII
jgi:hypothetical protein